MTSIQHYWKRTHTSLGRVKNTFGSSILDKIKAEIPKGKILDLGCSDGKSTEELCTLFPGCSVTGIDINEGKVQEAIARAGRKAEYLVEDGFNCGFPDESFDAVVSMNNLCLSIAYDNLAEQKLRQYLAGITRLSRRYLLFSGDYLTHDDAIVMEKHKDSYSTLFYKPGAQRPCKIIEEVLTNPIVEPDDMPYLDFSAMFFHRGGEGK